MNLINSDGTLHRNNTKRFIQAVYDYANGRINYINKSKYLKFTELESEDSSHSISGERMLDHIEINLSSLDLFSHVLHYDDKQEEQVKGYIIHIVLHELAHMDQAVEYGQEKKFKKKYWKHMENANDTYTYNWIIKHREELVRRFGPFLLDLAYKNDAYSYDNRYAYKRISSLSDILKSLLYFFSNVDIEKLIRKYRAVFIMMILKLSNGAHFKCLILGKKDDSPAKIRKIRDLISFLETNIIRKKRVFISRAWVKCNDNIVMKPDSKPTSGIFPIPFVVISLEESREEADVFTIDYKKEKA